MPNTPHNHNSHPCVAWELNMDSIDMTQDLHTCCRLDCDECRTHCEARAKTIPLSELIAEVSSDV